jgi:hypothetical protein
MVNVYTIMPDGVFQIIKDKFPKAVIYFLHTARSAGTDSNNRGDDHGFH